MAPCESLPSFCFRVTRGHIRQRIEEGGLKRDIGQTALTHLKDLLRQSHESQRDMILKQLTILTDIQTRVHGELWRSSFEMPIDILFASSATSVSNCIENSEKVSIDATVPSCFVVSKPLPGPLGVALFLSFNEANASLVTRSTNSINVVNV